MPARRHPCHGADTLKIVPKGIRTPESGMPGLNPGFAPTDHAIHLSPSPGVCSFPSGFTPISAGLIRRKRKYPALFVLGLKILLTH